MVAIDKESRKQRGGVTIPTKCFIPLALLFVLFTVQHVKTLLLRRSHSSSRGIGHETVVKYQESAPLLRNPTHTQEQCKLFMAESSMAPGAGLGIFAGHGGYLANEFIGAADLCIFLGDAPKQSTHIRSHTFGFASFFGQYEGSNSRAACEGIATTFNTNGVTHVNTKLVSPIQATTAGVRRDSSPGAGSITHHFGMRAQALDTIPAGQELSIWYGDWDDFFEGKELGPRQGRKVEWLDRNGWCIDNVEIRTSTIPGAGRGTFMKRRLAKGHAVMPAPLQAFKNREIFKNTEPEQLYVNYCLQPERSNMIFFPYGPAVGAINHSKKLANVRYQWSTHPMHRADILEMNYRQFWENIYPGALILEMVALRDLHPGEELFMDYGDAWAEAWDSHVEMWQPLPDAADYAYPEDMDETENLRTVVEQEINPYPNNLITMCATPDHERNEKQIEWYEPEGELAEYMVYCHILEKRLGPNGDFVYDVSLLFFKRHNKAFTRKEYEFDRTALKEDLYVSWLR